MSTLQSDLFSVFFIFTGLWLIKSVCQKSKIKENLDDFTQTFSLITGLALIAIGVEMLENMLTGSIILFSFLTVVFVWRKIKNFFYTFL